MINLFPGILPASSVFTCSLPSLHNYVDIYQVIWIKSSFLSF